jgi:dTDP-4-dehydrorhamnose 3,5-epimerase-like enzyme
MSEIALLKGGLAIDDRGEVGFVNEFDFEAVRRFYTISNHNTGFIRAWHGHKFEQKHLTVVSGAFVVAAVEIDNWDSPAKDLPVNRFILNAKQPAVLQIPPGYANGIMSLTDDAKVMVFSSSSLEESIGDDYRFDAHYWDAWTIDER